jgi:phage terminase large subunit GpA-like protein
MPIRFLKAISKGIKPDPNITITEWADRYRYLPQESTKEYGLYHSSRTPYLIELMNELSPQSRTQIVVLQKGTQLGATELGNNLLFCIADLFPAPCMWAMPTGEMAKKHSKKRIAPSVIKTPRLKNKIKEARARNSGNTILTKEFPGGSWVFTGSNSPAAARSESIKILVLDDYDGFESDIGGEGEPGDLFCKRTDTFGDSKKIYKNSTPTIKNHSNIEREYKESSKGLYFVPCPSCGEFIELLWGYLKFDKTKVEEKTIYLECPKCKAHIREYQKTKMLSGGKWIHSKPENPKKGYKINSLYSPVGWVSWKQIINEFLDAKDNVEKLKVWNNTRMAETFEEAGDQPEWTELKARCEPYDPMTVPDGGKILTAGVDTHDNRLDVVIRAWGAEEENWLIYWGQIYGSPGKQEVWGQLDLLLDYNYQKSNGDRLHLRYVSIDAMGHHTQDVYWYCRKRYPIVIPVKGASGTAAQILNGAKKKDVDYKGRIIKNGVELWSVGTEIAKMTIYQRLKQTESGGRGYYHNYIGLADEYFEQLTAERLVTKYIDGFPRQKWVVTRSGGANHALDCEVYAYHAALRAGIDRMSFNPKPPGLNKKKRRRVISKGING